MGHLYRFDEYIRSFINKYNSSNKNKIISYQSASVCTTNNSYSVLQIQPAADLIVDMDCGLFSNDQKYKNKIWNFIQKSFDDNYDLVLTPEYSVPLECIDLLLENKDKIESGTLYCLCCNGIKHKDFEAFLKNCEDKAFVCSEAWNNFSNKNKIVCCLLYITKTKFKTEDGYFEEVFVVPQFKTSPMKDFFMDFEKAVLSCGTKIIEFGQTDETKFLSIICADVFNSTLVSELKEELSNNRLLIFHPQLNSKPQNDHFRLMRSNLINYAHKGNVKFIALNWAIGTSFIVNGKKDSAISKSWSAVYEKYDIRRFPEYMTILNKNAIYGLNIAHDHHVVACYLSSNEHVIEMNIANVLNPEDTSDTVLIAIQKCFKYDKELEKYYKYEEFCKEMVNDFFVQTKEFNELINCDKCSTCNVLPCRLSRLNEFVSSIYNSSIEKEFEIINDGKTTSITSEHYSSIYTREKLFICKRIYNKMKNKEVTEKFQSISPVFKYEYIKQGDFVFNAKYITDRFGESWCRVIYLKYAHKSDAEKIYSDISKQKQEFAENTIIFYEDEYGINVYPEKTDTKIDSTQIIPDNTSILGGKTDGI